MSIYERDPSTGELNLLAGSGGGSGGDDKNFLGTSVTWDAMTLEQQNAYDTMDFTDENEYLPFAGSGAGFHNSLYRGKNLGTSVTSAQYDAIDAGTFNDMFIGDYWTIGGIIYRIAAFDYWLNVGHPTICSTHHVVIVPDCCIGSTQPMNDTATTTGGYIGTKMYTENILPMKTRILTDVGSAHILSHYLMLSSSVDSNGIANGFEWRESTVELMNEMMVYGGNSGSKSAPSGMNNNMGADKTQLPLFAYNPSIIPINNVHWWLRDVVSTEAFSAVDYHGYPGAGAANLTVIGVRPVFGICKSNS